MKISHRIRGLMLADILVKFAFFVMQNYLTDVWKLSFTHAAGILNIWGGVCMILPLFFQVLVDSYLGNFKMLVISSIAYTMGMILVTMSALNSSQSALLFYTGMSLVAVGVAGYSVSLQPLLHEQKHTTDDGSGLQGRLLDTPDDDRLTEHMPAIEYTLFFYVILIGIIVLPSIKSWVLPFGIPAICTALATILFLRGWSEYRKVAPQGWSPLTRICRVFVAAAFKTSKRIPSGARRFYRRSEQESFTDTRWLRCLENAAIILPDEEDHQLCSVAQVEDAKITVRMVPVLLTFLVYGVVLSIRNTYFIEQANHMHRKLGSWKVPIEVILLVCGWSDELPTMVIDNIYEEMFVRSANRLPRKLAPVLCLSGTLHTVLSCIIAAGVEMLRLKVIRTHGLVDKPNEDVPMNVAWLLPQFCLLAAADLSLKVGFRGFYTNESPESMAKYQPLLMNGVTGLGVMSSVGLVHVLGGQTNWFHSDLSRSRLDNFYWVLTALSSVNFLFLIVVFKCYRYKKQEAVDEQVVDTGGGSSSIPS